MKRSKLEQETIVLLNEAEQEAEIYTFNSAWKKQLMELCETRPDKVRLLQKGEDSMTFQFPKKWLKVVPPRIPSPAQLEVIARMNEKRHGGRSHQET